MKKQQESKQQRSKDMPKLDIISLESEQQFGNILKFSQPSSEQDMYGKRIMKVSYKNDSNSSDSSEDGVSKYFSICSSSEQQQKSQTNTYSKYDKKYGSESYQRNSNQRNNSKHSYSNYQYQSDNCYEHPQSYANVWQSKKDHIYTQNQQSPHTNQQNSITHNQQQSIKHSDQLMDEIKKEDINDDIDPNQVIMSLFKTNSKIEKDRANEQVDQDRANEQVDQDRANEQVDQDSKTRWLACGLWLFGCTCWVIGYLYSNVNNIPPQVTNIWRATLMILLNYLIIRYKNKSLDIPYVDNQTTHYRKYAQKFHYILIQAFNKAQNRLSQSSHHSRQISESMLPNSPKIKQQSDSSTQSTLPIQQQYFWCLIRTLTLIVNAFIFTLSQFYLPLPIVHTINCTAPIFVIIFDYLINSNRLNSQQLSGVVLTTIGILIILLFQQQPKIQQNMTYFKNYIPITSSFFIGAVCVLNAALFGFSCVIIKKMTKIHHSVILFYMGMGLLLFSGLTYPYTFRLHSKDPKAQQTAVNGKQSLSLGLYIGGFLFSGIIFALGQLSQMYALKICRETGRVLIMENFTVVVAYIISVGIFGEPIYWMCLFGGVIAIAGVIRTIK